MTEASSSSWSRLVVRVVALLAAFALGAVLFGGDPSPETPVAADADTTVWTCAMHPQIRKSEPGQCPICGMDLIPASDGEGGDAPDQVVLSERAQTLAQLRTAEVHRHHTATADLRLLGRIEPDESTRKNVTTWIGGRIDRLHVAVTGERIRRGQVVATLYSPEVYAAHQDLLTAHEQVARLAGSPEAARQAARAAYDAARARLRLLGVPASEIETMQAASTPTRSVAIRSPFGGTVIERVATEGAYVETGAPLYRVADLSTLWVQLDAYERDLSRLSVGQDVRLEVDALPGETFEGRVAFIDPTVDPQRRTAQVRVEVDNPDGRLRPGMFAEAVVAAGPSAGDAPLVIPDTAPLFTGKRSIVYVAVPAEDRVAYAPRTVRLGPRLGDVYPVVAGLTEGERVVTRGAFVLDADLQIRGGPSMMTAEDDTSPHADQAPVPLTADQRGALAPVVAAYLEVQQDLAEDDHAAAVEAATQLEQAVVDVTFEGPAAEPWAGIGESLRGHARHVALSDGLEGAREGFEPLSLAIETLLRRFGNPLDAPVHVAFCPMAMGSAGARWVQQGEAIDNAYFGASMRTCGEVREAVAPGTYLSPPTRERGAPAAGGHRH